MQKQKKTREEEPDYNLYDAPESEQYVQGYVLAIAVIANSFRFLNVQRLIHDKDLNVYAYIPTDIPISDKTAGVLCYIVFRTWFEFIVGRSVINIGQYKEDIGKYVYHIPTSEPERQPVWFHKSWILPSYDPIMYDTGAKKYERVMSNVPIRNLIPKEELLEYRRDYCRQSKCYEPISEENQFCKNYMKGLANPKICNYCAASKHGQNCLTTRG